VRTSKDVSSEKTADLEARGGIEPPIKVLQTFALPLGDRASEAHHFTKIVNPASRFAVQKRYGTSPIWILNLAHHISGRQSNFSPNWICRELVVVDFQRFFRSVQLN
jgi:hypothetical protein